MMTRLSIAFHIGDMNGDPAETLIVTLKTRIQDGCALIDYK